jgi:Glycosyltransferases involved in cell wall biogenesis
MVVTKIISAVIPAYSDVSIVKNSVLSLATQWIPDDTFMLEIIIVDDNPNGEYSYFTSEPFLRIVNKNVCIKIIKNAENYGQGISRQIGIDNALSNWFVLCDEDDMYAPNAMYRFWEILNEQYCGGEDGKPVALIAAPVYGFDINKSRTLIHSHAIWVNGKLFNRQFLRDNNIFFPTGESSHRAEDYPFIESLNYAINNNPNFKRIDFDDDADTFYYWIPNRKSRSRSEQYYTALLTPFTTTSALALYQYKKWYNEYYNLTSSDKDEEMKYEILNITAYTFHSYTRWLYDMANGWKDDPKCVEKDWERLKNNLRDMRKELRIYWNEICPSDIHDIMYGIKHNSDIQFVEPFICSFNEWVTKGHKTDKMSFDEIREYCSGLKFDEAKHEINTSYVKAWVKRHNI